MGPQNGEDVGVATTRKTFAILETLRESEGLSIAEITRRTELTKSTVYRHLKTLQELGYVIERDGEYYIGMGLLEIAEQTRNREPGYTVAQRKVFDLGRETDERAMFLVEENFEGVYLYRYGSPSNTMVGERRPLHALASGKVILAEFDDDRLERFVERKELGQHAKNTITGQGALREELAEVREQGYALNDEEYMDGLFGVAVPVYTPEDELLGSLGLFGPTSRFTDEYLYDDLIDRLWDKAGEIKVTLAYG
ncbi:helix-turn-helix domain-containing protein [Halovenus sp. WSH3]|uniref:Helix-turn-helix domain-containing protein n=1 Tax=Halovenus carboxidivorans TaxID=2692199 RepID=A0A6B0T4N3_9EURY|nr:IclR family transcriptional regulator [Halovenus carboxidivorans]MXR51927.1 helix-turn-helix domain-containing protein [Halovenus carboxidivorans]